MIAAEPVKPVHQANHLTSTEDNPVKLPISVRKKKATLVGPLKSSENRPKPHHQSTPVDKTKKLSLPPHLQGKKLNKLIISDKTAIQESFDSLKPRDGKPLKAIGFPELVNMLDPEVAFHSLSLDYGVYLPGMIEDALKVKDKDIVHAMRCVQTGLINHLGPMYFSFYGLEGKNVEKVLLGQDVFTGRIK